MYTRKLNYKTTMTFRLDAAIKQEIERQAKRYNISPSKLVEKIISLHIGKDAKWAKR
jgi:hypothetical protein